MASVLAKYGVKAGDDLLKRWFTFHSRSTAFDAARRIAALNHPRFIPFLLAELKKQQTTVFGSYAAWTLGQMRAKEAVPELLKALKKKEQSKQFLEEVIEALGKTRDKRAMIPLARMARHEDSEIAYAAAETLGKIVMEHKPVSDKKLLAEIQETYRERVISRIVSIQRAAIPWSREDERDLYAGSGVRSQLQDTLYRLLNFNERDYDRINQLLKPMDDIEGSAGRFMYRRKRFVLAESIFFRPQSRLNIPKNNADREKVDFWVSLRRDAAQRGLGEVIKIMTSKNPG